MGSILNGNKYSPEGSRVPTDLLPPAIRYEAARAAIFEEWGNFVRANDCLRLKRYYERRAMQECIPPPCITVEMAKGFLATEPQT
jgi:hypothetical protein